MRRCIRDAGGRDHRRTLRLPRLNAFEMTERVAESCAS